MACRDIISYQKLNTKTDLETFWIFCANVVASTASKNVTIIKLFLLEPVGIYKLSSTCFIVVKIRNILWI